MPGKRNWFADATSRHPVGDGNSCGVEMSSYSMSMSTIFETGDRVEAAHMLAIKSDLNKARAITWERVKHSDRAS